MPPWTANRVIVLGGGSAGFLAALALRARLPDLPVTVVRSTRIGVIGVGEGSTLPLTQFLHGYLRVDPKTFFEVARPTWKLGLKFLWGPRPSFHYTFGPQLETQPAGLPLPAGFYCDEGPAGMACEDAHSALMADDRAFARAPSGAPELHPRVAYHFENERLVEFLERAAAAAGARTVDDTVAHVRRDDRGGVASLALASGAELAADLFVDCSGFASLLLGGALAEPFVSYKPTLFCERAIVGGWDRPPGDPIRPYTTCETMDAGWAWQIEHERRVNRGYVYAPAFVTDAAAESEFRARNPRLGPTRVVRFVSGRYDRAWVANVVAIGNAAGFVEPLEASSLGVIALRARLLADVLANCRREVRPSQVALFNRENAANWDSIRDFLAVHYKFNTRLDTPFWQACRADADLAGAAPIVDHYRENGPSPFWGPALFGPHEAFGIAGYLALLVGQQVPYRRATPVTDADRTAWAAHQQAQRAIAGRGMTVAEALTVIRSPKWRWG